MNDSQKAEQPEENQNAGATSNPNADSDDTTPEDAKAEGVELDQPRVEVVIDDAAEKDFDKIGRGKHQAQIQAKIDALETNPLPQDARPIKGENFKAKGWNFYRVDAGEYRIIYDLDEQTKILTIVTIVVIGQRNDDKAYRLLQRRFG